MWLSEHLLFKEKSWLGPIYQQDFGQKSAVQYFVNPSTDSLSKIESHSKVEVIKQFDEFLPQNLKKLVKSEKQWPFFILVMLNSP